MNDPSAEPAFRAGDFGGSGSSRSPVTIRKRAKAAGFLTPSDVTPGGLPVSPFTWPKVLLAAKTYANDPLKPTLTVGFCTF